MAPAAEAQYVTCGLGEEVFAVPVTLVREILDYRPPSRSRTVPTICSAYAMCAG